MNWSVYIIRCTDNSLYTGITTDVYKRFSQHAKQKGAKFFWGRQPEELVYVETKPDRSSASKREFVIKKLKRLDKLSLITSEINQIKDFPG